MVIIAKNTHETHRYQCQLMFGCKKLFKTKKSLQQHSCVREINQVMNLQQDDEIIEEEIQKIEAIEASDDNNYHAVEDDKKKSTKVVEKGKTVDQVRFRVLPQSGHFTVLVFIAQII